MTRAKRFANEVMKHEVEVTDEGICHKILTGLLRTFNFVSEGFTLRDRFQDSARSGKTKRGSGGRNSGRGRDGNGGRGKHDGRGR